MDDQEFKKMIQEFDAAINSAKNKWHTPIIGSVSITIPKAGGPYHYKIHRGNVSSRKFNVGDRVILDPDNGTGPGTVTATHIRVSNAYIMVLHDNGIMTSADESQFLPHADIKVGNRVSYKLSYRIGTVKTVISNPTHPFNISYEILWDDNSVSIGNSEHLSLIDETQNAQMPPPPPCCDCGAKSVGSNRHSSWCTVSDLTSLN